MSFPDLDTERIQAENTMVQLKGMTNSLKNRLAPESTDMTNLQNYCDSLSEGDWKTKVTNAIAAFNNVYEKIVDEGF